LNVNGTSSNPVYVTSIKDDSLGGQTNNDASPPGAGNWAKVYFRGGSNGTLNYLEMRYGGNSGQGGAMLYTDGDTDVTVNHSVFKNSHVCAISSDPGYEPTLTNMTPADFTGSQFNGICMRNLSVGVNTTWDETEVAYVLWDDITVTSGFTLTWGPGIVVKPREYYVEMIVDGTLNVNGTSSNPVYVTSIKDDSLGGQTNNDASPPGAGNWARIYFRAGASGVLNHIYLRYGGNQSSDFAAVHVENASPHLQECDLWNNARGLSSYGASSNPTIHNCNIHGNLEYGVFNAQSGHWIDATNNSWGSITGPYDPTPPGTDGDYNYGSGDRVSDYVHYRPWAAPPLNYTYIPLVLR
jgi:hypothetical protein